MKKHRNSQKRICVFDASYFLTSRVQGHIPYFKEPIFCDLFVENLRMCKKLKEFYLYGWVLCYDHFHLLLRPWGDFDHSKIMQFLKCHVARNINVLTSNEGAIGQSRLRVREGFSEYQSDIEKFDQYVQKLKKQFLQKHPNGSPFPKFQWQKSFHDHYIRGETDFMNHMGYILSNPNKHGLPENWPYIYTNPEYEDLIDDPF